MTREDFCKLLVKAKETARVSLSGALKCAAELTFKKIEVIESGLKDFNLSDALLYLRMCNQTFELSYYDVVYTDSLDEIRRYIVSERSCRDWTAVDLAKHSHVSSNIICAFESGRCGLKVDTFLRIITALDITIEIN